jgi:sugar/nucleoside kinase (ribokinase family)
MKCHSKQEAYGERMAHDLRSDVLVIGNNTVDHVFILPGPLATGTKLSAVSALRCAGGQAANVAYSLAGLGVRTHYVGVFGGDDDGRWTHAALADLGVHLAGCRIVADCRTHTAIVVVDQASGERTIIMHRDPGLTLPASSVRPEYVECSRLVYIDNHEPEATREAVQLAKRFGVPVVADAEESNATISAILPDVDCLIAPGNIIRDLGGRQDLVANLAEVRRMGPRCCVATLGADGAIAIDVDGFTHVVPAAQCKAVDTTGAGDAFHAGYLAAYLKGYSVAGSLQFAARIAAAKCEVYGPRLPLERIQRLRLIVSAPDTEA